MTEATTENQLAVIIEQSGLEKTKSQVLLEKFTDYFNIASEWEAKAKAIVITDASQLSEMKQAREGRLFLVKKRTAIEATRKALKEDSLREGQTIDSIAKILKNLIEPIEKDLEEKELFAFRQEESRKETLRVERSAKLSQYVSDVSIYPLKDMSEQGFIELFEGVKQATENRIAAEKKAEEDRIAKEKAEAEERERIRVENIRLKAEAEERERAAIIERKKQAEILEKQKAESEAKLKAERAKAEQLQKRINVLIEAGFSFDGNNYFVSDFKRVDPATIQGMSNEDFKDLVLSGAHEVQRLAAIVAHNDKIAREKAENDRIEKERIAAELKAKQEAEAKAEAEKQAVIEAELSKGDADKFADLITSLTALKTKYTFKSKKYQKLYGSVNTLIDKIIDYSVNK